jgi:hypothetical protein
MSHLVWAATPGQRVTFLLSGTNALIRALTIFGGTHGTTITETTRLPDRQKGAAQIKSEIQASLTAAVERQGGEAAQAARQGKHTNRRHQPEASAPAGIDLQQGAARGHLTQASQSFTLQSSEDGDEGSTLIPGRRSAGHSAHSERGKAAPGEGNNSAGDVAPGLFTAARLVDVAVYLNDKTNALLPP